MTSRAQPGNGLMAEWDLGESQWKEGMDANLRFLSGAVQLVLERSDGTMPTTPTTGMLAIGTGGKVVGYLGSAWVDVATPIVGWEGWDKALGKRVWFDGSAWAEVSGGNALTGITPGQDITVDNTDPLNPVVGTSIAISELLPTSGKFWRFNLTEGTAYLGEIALKLNGVIIDHTGVIATATKDNANAPRLLPGIDLYWGNISSTPVSVTYEFPADVVADSLDIVNENTTYQTNAFNLEVSNDGTSWTPLATWDGITWTANKQRLNFDFPSDTRVPRFPLEAPVDGKSYVRKDRAWAEAPAAGGQVDSVVAGTNVTVDATDPVAPVINVGDAPLGSLAYQDGNRAPFINLMSDSGKFTVKANPLLRELFAGTFPFSTSKVDVFMNASSKGVWTEVGKYIFNNTTYGGTGGELTQPVIDLLTAMGRGQAVGGRYGVEFYVAEITTNTSSQSPHPTYPNYLLSVMDAAVGAIFASSGYGTFAGWVRVVTGTTVYVRKISTAPEVYLNGVLQTVGSDVAITPEMGWVHIRYVGFFDTGYAAGFPYIYTEHNQTIQLALPAFYHGAVDTGIHTSPLLNINELIP